jgi:hypothetical protein
LSGFAISAASFSCCDDRAFPHIIASEAVYRAADFHIHTSPPAKPSTGYGRAARGSRCSPLALPAASRWSAARLPSVAGSASLCR